MKKIKINNGMICRGCCTASSSSYIDSPFVIYNNTMFHIWYSVFNGSRWSIHYATSKDGILWITHGPISILGNVNIKDDNFIYKPSVIYDGKKFKMWYISHGSIAEINYAISEDGSVWKKQGTAIELGETGETDEIKISNPNVVFDGKIYHMWYTGSDRIHKRIHYATSIDGLNWTKHGVVIPLGTDDENDRYHTLDPFVIFDNGIFKMLYTGSDGCRYKILYAISKDGRNWTKHGVLKSLLPDYHNSDLHIETPCVIKDGDVYKMWFNGYINYKWGIYCTELSESILK